MKDNNYMHYLRNIAGAATLASVSTLATRLGVEGYFDEAVEKVLESKILGIGAEYLTYIFVLVPWIIYTATQARLARYYYSRPPENKAQPAEAAKHDNHHVIKIPEMKKLL